MDSRRNFIGKMTGGFAGAITVPPGAAGANSRIGFGVIGAGVRGQHLIREALGCPGTECVSVVDVYSARLEQASRLAPGAGLHKDYRDLLAEPGVDAVLIATPQHLHREHFLAALDAGKHVYLERAAALTAADAKAMKTLRESRPDPVVQVGHQFCSSGLAEDARRFLDAGWVGGITGIEANHYRNTPRGKPLWRQPVYPDMTPANIDWRAFQGGAPDREFDAERFANWRLYWDYSGGGVHEAFSQQLAFWCRALPLGIPHEVVARGSTRLSGDGREAPDTMSVLMDYAEGFAFNWHSSCGNSHLGTGEYLLGSDGTIYRGQQIRYWPQKVNRPGGRETQGRTRTAPRAHMSNFLAAIRGQAQPACPFEMGYRVSIACAMAVASYREKRTVRWKPELEEIA